MTDTNIYNTYSTNETALQRRIALEQLIKDYKIKQGFKFDLMDPTLVFGIFCLVMSLTVLFGLSFSYDFSGSFWLGIILLELLLVWILWKHHQEAIFTKKDLDNFVSQIYFNNEDYFKNQRVKDFLESVKKLLTLGPIEYKMLYILIGHHFNISSTDYKKAVQELKSDEFINQIIREIK